LLPDDGNRYEVVDGALVATPAPTTTHQTVSKRIQVELILQLERHDIALVHNAPIDVIFSETRSVQPDLVVVRMARRNIVTERGIEGAPDLVVEILSPSTEKTDREVKAKLYASEGVPEYWIADPEAHVIEVHVLGEDGYACAGHYGPGSRVISGLFDVDLEVDAIFAP
jgi:Uma2 family endonuclease